MALGLSITEYLLTNKAKGDKPYNINLKTESSWKIYHNLTVECICNYVMQLRFIGPKCMNCYNSLPNPYFLYGLLCRFFPIKGDAMMLQKNNFEDKMLSLLDFLQPYKEIDLVENWFCESIVIKVLGKWYYERICQTRLIIKDTRTVIKESKVFLSVLYLKLRCTYLSMTKKKTGILTQKPVLDVTKKQITNDKKKIMDINFKYTSSAFSRITNCYC
ncbi:hypothetical protein AGLY_004348 [Aphis glycines]|uniref:Uncharacterized protein n=1 Tax=Aphis glycines TaxID=307491 RepID=A0A6G0U057_APHGL|nr:hypothetical protein AGLY_004348 [Aphis glycines]